MTSGLTRHAVPREASESSTLVPFGLVQQAKAVPLPRPHC